MSKRQRRIALFILVAMVMGIVTVARSQNEAPAHHFRIVVGLKDKEETAWNGKITVTGGTVAQLQGWRFEGDDAVEGGSPQVTVQFAQGTVKFAAIYVPLGQPISYLDGQVRVERLPEVRLARAAAPLKDKTPYQDDYPAFWVHYKTGKQYLAWACYQNERDRVLLIERDGPGGAWSQPKEVAG